MLGRHVQASVAIFVPVEAIGVELDQHLHDLYLVVPHGRQEGRVSAVVRALDQVLKRAELAEDRCQLLVAVRDAMVQSW